MVRYKSTRGSLRDMNGAQAIIKGIAEDKGLYVPEAFPALPCPLSEMKGLSYRDVAFRVLSQFLTDYPGGDLRCRQCR